MALRCNGRLLRTPIVAAMLLGLWPALAWGQAAGPGPTDAWQEKLDGNWCDAERGCTHWWTLYRVQVGDDNSILISYRDTLFPVFLGQIQDPIGRWLIRGNKQDENGKDLEPKQPFNAVVNDIELAKEVIEGKVKGTLKAKIQDLEIDGIRVQEMGGLTISDAKITSDKPGDLQPGSVQLDGVRIDDATLTEEERNGSTVKAKKLDANRIRAEKIARSKIEGKFAGGSQIEISVPLQISDATIEATRKAKLKKAPKGGAGATPGDDDEDDQKGKIEIDATIKGKVTMPSGSIADWKGDFQGKFTALVQATVKGTYHVPPADCSEAGRPLSDEEEEDLKQRRRDPTHALMRSPGRYRSSQERDERTNRKALSFSKAALQLQAYAETTRAPRPAEPHTRGKFMRKVKGTVSAIDPFTITLDLPALPILDHKCRVIDETPKGAVPELVGIGGGVISGLI